MKTKEKKNRYDCRNGLKLRPKVAIAVGLKSLASTVDFGLRSNTVVEENVTGDKFSTKNK
jgi:hypothetical protein